jgi:uncharacterized membrane protein YfhO
VADYAFRSVVVPKGEHVVEFYYEPQIFKLGFLLSGIFAVLFVALIFKLKLKDI